MMGYKILKDLIKADGGQSIFSHYLSFNLAIMK